MTVVEGWVDSAIVGVDYDLAMKQKPGNISLNDLSEKPSRAMSTLELLQRACALCSKASFMTSDDNVPIMNRECLGDASEISLIKYIETRTDIASLQDIRREHKELYCIPFNSKNKWMLTVNELKHEGEESLVLLKGAPERVISRCSSIMINGVQQPFNEEWKQHFQDAYDYFASKGSRVLGFAQRLVNKSLVNKQIEMDGNGNDSNPNHELAFPVDELTFIGLFALTDPPKVGVKTAIERCKKAGIQVVMVTGDHPATAKAIAKQIGII